MYIFLLLFWITWAVYIIYFLPVLSEQICYWFRSQFAWCYQKCMFEILRTPDSVFSEYLVLCLLSCLRALLGLRHSPHYNTWRDWGFAWVLCSMFAFLFACSSRVETPSSPQHVKTWAYSCGTLSWWWCKLWGFILLRFFKARQPLKLAVCSPEQWQHFTV